METVKKSGQALSFSLPDTARRLPAFLIVPTDQEPGTGYVNYNYEIKRILPSDAPSTFMHSANSVKVTIQNGRLIPTAKRGKEIKQQ